MEFALPALGLASPAAAAAPAPPAKIPFLDPSLTCSGVLRGVLYEQLDLTGDVDIYLTTTRNSPATERLILYTDARGRKNPPAVRAFLTAITTLMLVHPQFHADLTAILFIRARFHMEAEAAYMFLASLTGTLGGNIFKHIYLAIDQGKWTKWRDQFNRMAAADMFRRLRYITIENVIHDKDPAVDGSKWGPNHLEKLVTARKIIQNKAIANGIDMDGNEERNAPDSGYVWRAFWQPTANTRLATVRLAHWSVVERDLPGWRGVDPSTEKTRYDAANDKKKKAKAREAKDHDASEEHTIEQEASEQEASEDEAVDYEASVQEAREQLQHI